MTDPVSTPAPAAPGGSTRRRPPQAAEDDARVALIVGAFGQDNPGDEALLAAAVAAVRATPGWRPLVATARPDDTAARLDVVAIPASGPAVASASAHADALVVGGGTIFKELHPTSGRTPGSLLRRTAALTGAFHARRRAVALVGVGAAPIDRPVNRRLARSIARHADLLVLRDPESAAILTDLGVPAPLRVGADLSWLTAPPPAAPSTRPEGAPLGVAVSHLAVDDEMIDRLIEALAAVAATGRAVELEPWQGSPLLGADARLATRMARAIGPGARLVPPPDDLADATARMAGRSAALALRFHATVAAAQAGTSFVALTHEPKLAAMARCAGQPAVAVDDAVPVIAAKLQQAIDGPAPSTVGVLHQRRRAEATADLLHLLLAGEGASERLADLDLVPEPAPA